MIQIQRLKSFWFIIIMAVGALTAVLFPWLTVKAVTCSVPAGYAAIQDAIDDLSCDTILIAAGTYTENLTISRTVTLRGDNLGGTVISGNYNGRVVNIPHNISQDYAVSISDLRITEGDVRGLADAAGGGIYNGETLTLDNVTIDTNFADSGGAIATGPYAVTTIQNSVLLLNMATVIAHNIHDSSAVGSLTILNTSITGYATGSPTMGIYSTSANVVIRNSSVNEHDGGGIYIDRGNLTLEGSSASGNTAYGVTIISGNATPSEAFISYSAINQNVVPSGTLDQGEGLAILGNVYVTADNTSFDNNSKEGISTNSYLSYTPALTLTNSTVSGNQDGGLFVAGDVVIQDSQITDNIFTNYGGRGIYHYGGTLLIERSVISNNQGNGSDCGGGILKAGGSAQIRDTVIADNYGAYQGGGFCMDAGDVDIRRSTVSGNTAAANGGGIYIRDGLFVPAQLALSNSTIANNSADEDGGGIFVASGAADLTNVTIARNTADADNDGVGAGGGYFIAATQPVTVTLTNTLAAANLRGISDDSDCNGIITSGGTNLIRVARPTCSGFVPSDLTGSPGSPLNAYLGVLQNNGGSTETIAIGSNSPAADAGQNSVCNAAPINGKDQRQYGRANQDGNNDGGGDGDACDIGAYERSSAAPTATPTPTNTPTSTNTPTATATNTPGPSPAPTNTPTTTPSNTPGPSPTPTNTPTATPTNTPGPSPTPDSTIDHFIYLPLVLR